MEETPDGIEIALDIKADGTIKLGRLNLMEANLGKPAIPKSLKSELVAE